MEGCSPSEISSIRMRRGDANRTRETISIFCSPPLSVPAFCRRRSRTIGKYWPTRSLPAPMDRRRNPAVVAHAEPQILLDGEVLEQGLLLRRIGDATARDQIGGKSG